MKAAPLTMAFVVLLLLLTPLQHGGRGADALAAVQVLLVAWALARLLGPRRPRPGLSWVEGILLCAPLAVGVLSTLGSPGPLFPSGLVLTDRLFYLLGFFLVATTPWSSEQARRLALAPVVLAGVGGLVASGSALLGTARPGWPFLTPVQLSAWLAFGAILGLALLLERPARWSRVLLGLLAGAAALGVVATASRGGAVALGVGSLAVVILRLRGGLRRRLPAVGVLAAAATLLVVLVYVLRLGQGVDPYQHDRPRIWAAALEVVADHPWTGMGPGQLPFLNGPYQFPREIPESPARYTRTWSNAHSLYVEVLAEEGLLGGTAFLLALGLFLSWMQRPGPGAGALSRATRLAPLLGLLAQGLVEDLAQAPGVVWPPLVLGGLALATARRPVEEAPQEPQPRGKAALALALVWVMVGAVLLPWASHRLAEVSVRRGDYTARREGLRRAAEWNPIQPWYRLEVGELVRDRSPEFGPGAWAEAFAYLDAARRLAPALPEVHRALGRLHMRAAVQLGPLDRGIERAAVRSYRAAWRRSPHDPFLRLEAARALAVLGRREEALAQVDESLGLEPRYLAARAERMRLLGSAGRLEEAVGALEDLLRARDQCAASIRRTPYERDLCRIDPGEVEALADRLQKALEAGSTPADRGAP